MNPHPHRFDFPAIGTSWAISTAAPVAEGTRREVRRTVERYDATWSRFRPDSAVRRLADTGGPTDLGADALEILPLLLRLAQITQGAMTPLIGGSLEHLGYDPAYSLTARTGFLPAPPLASLVLDGSTAMLTAPAVLDVGAAGKGQLVDRVGEVLRAGGHEDAVVDAGGDLRVIGGPVRVALEHPFDPAVAVGTLEVEDRAVAGSAVNRRAWPGGDGRGLHHVLDGRTGRPVDTVAATWVVADTAILADALATALFFAEPDVLGADFSFRFVRMWTDGRAHWSADLPGEVFR